MINGKYRAAFNSRLLNSKIYREFENIIHLKELDYFVDKITCKIYNRKKRRIQYVLEYYKGALTPLTSSKTRNSTFFLKKSMVNSHRFDFFFRRVISDRKKF